MLKAIDGGARNSLWESFSNTGSSSYNIGIISRTETPPPSDSDVSVTLSIEAKLISRKNTIVAADWSSIYGESGILHELNSQLISDGESAEFLKEIPDSNDPTRLDLATQAVDFLLKKEDNPFKNTSRETLSRIAFDGSGAFTQAERFAAILETSRRDNDYANRVYEQQQQFRGDDTRRYLISISSKLHLASGMNAEEKEMHSLSETELSAEINHYTSKLGIQKPSPVLYESLTTASETILSATTDRSGKAIWSELPVKSFFSDDAIASSYTPSENSDFPDRFALENSKKWITVYAHIDRMR